MKAHKTLVTYISLGVVVIIVLGLLLGSLVLACRRWRCPYPCCCVWRCFQDRDQMRVAAHHLYSAPRMITWGIQCRYESPTMQVGLSYTVRTGTINNLGCCAILYGAVQVLFYWSFKIHICTYRLTFTNFSAVKVQ